jgi:hypothetical protein
MGLNKLRKYKRLTAQMKTYKEMGNNETDKTVQYYDCMVQLLLLLYMR